MEVISYNFPPCCKLNRRLLAKKSSSRQKVKIPLSRKHRILCPRVQLTRGSLEFSDKHHLFSNNVYHRKVSRPFKALKGFNNGESKVLSGNYDSYVIGAEDEVEGMSKTGESVTKVLIPGLPDESNGECSAQISSCFWEWKPKFNVHFEKSGSKNVNSPPVLFLPGFGVGSFHYENQLKDLGRDYRVWAIDFLGQGMSLPFEDPTSSSEEEGITEGKDSLWGFGDKSELWATGLVYSIDLWRDQVRHFVEEVKKQVPEAPYYQISPAGHCPHDEVPEVVNYLLRGWIKNLESKGAVALPLLQDMETEISKDLEFVREGSKKSVMVRFLGSKISLWNLIKSSFKSPYQMM